MITLATSNRKKKEVSNFFLRNLPWEEPASFFRKLSHQNPLVFLDSQSVKRYRVPRGHVLEHVPSVPGTIANRSFIAWDPWFWVRGRKNSLLLRESSKGQWRTLKTATPYETFQKIFRLLVKGRSFPEGAGAYGAFNYEAGEYFENLPKSQGAQKRNYFEFIFPKQILIFDHAQKKIKWIGVGQSERYRVPRGHVQEHIPLVPGTIAQISNLRAQFTRKGFEAIVDKAKGYIRAGDIYQANLSQEFSFNFSGEPAAVYEKLRKLNPSPFSSFIRLGKKVILSSSPELLMRKTGSRCLTRPIAGTRPRGQSEKQKISNSKALLLSPKERAEHLMLLDLERNDLGRVCKFGTVGVKEKMILEHYSHVIHIVSQVEGEMLPEKDAFDLIRALFPGGTITGCPKIRSMEIIHELEKKPREFYTGSLGFLGFGGEAVLNIIIRTIVLDGAKGSLRVGAGIVADSNPSREYWETIQKGKVLFKALGIGMVPGTEGTRS